MATVSSVRIDEQERSAWSWVRLKDVDGEWTEWAAVGLFLLIEERPVLVELRVVPAMSSLPFELAEWSRTPEEVPDPAGLPMTLLQNLRLHDLYEPIQEVAHNLAYTGRVKGKSYGKEFEEVWRSLADARSTGPKDDLYFASWASRISEKTTDQSTARSPIQALADETGLSRGQIRDIAHKARERGVLSKPPQGGRGGGVLTEKGRTLLQAETKRRKKAR